MVAGPQYPAGSRWPANVERIEHLAPAGHRAFYNAMGFALNVTTDLSYFARINPCGFEASVMTSLDKLVPGVDPASVKAALVEELGVALGRTVA